jgi:hypothetical protein
MRVLVRPKHAFCPQKMQASNAQSKVIAQRSALHVLEPARRFGPFLAAPKLFKITGQLRGCV